MEGKMQRTIMQDLVEWKDAKRRKPLVLSGVRQCGKTFVLMEFGRKYFEETAYFNFEKNPELSEVFEYNYDVERILDELANLILGKPIVSGKTLVIFDEIQACHRAITALKYFCEDKQALHIVAAGSLLGVVLKSEEVSFPVGKVERRFLYPMSFLEFVQADGGEKLLKGLMALEKGREIPELYVEPLKKYLKLYYIIGGMPEVVQEWVETHDFNKIEKIQDSILMDYASDFSKHAPLEEVPKLRLIWDSVVEQLAKDNQKFMFSHVKKGARARELENALQWLRDAGLVYTLEKIENPELPLASYADSTYFKVYFCDVGLLRKKANIYYKTILEEPEDFFRFKGFLAENFALCEMKVLGLPAWFWKSGNTAEVDFLTEYQGKVVPIEIKSADNTQAKSLRQFIKKYSPSKAFKCSLKNMGSHKEGETLVCSLPLYLFFQIDMHMSL